MKIRKINKVRYFILFFDCVKGGCSSMGTVISTGTDYPERERTCHNIEKSQNVSRVSMKNIIEISYFDYKKWGQKKDVEEE